MVRTEGDSIVVSAAKAEVVTLLLPGWGEVCQPGQILGSLATGDVKVALHVPIDRAGLAPGSANGDAGIVEGLKLVDSGQSPVVMSSEG